MIDSLKEYAEASGVNVEAAAELVAMLARGPKFEPGEWNVEHQFIEGQSMVLSYTTPWVFDTDSADITLDVEAPEFAEVTIFEKE